MIEGWRRHHQLHANDLGPIGDLLAHAQGWDIEPTAVMALLKGASPATVDAARYGRLIAEALEGAGIDATTVTSIDIIRAAPQAAAILDEYLDLFGWRLVSDYDIEGLTLHELPGAVCAIVRRAALDSTDSEQEAIDDSVELEKAEAELRADAADPALFDELLTSARKAYGIRDDNGPLTWAWITAAALTFELDIPELVAMLNGVDAPSNDELVERARHRTWEGSLRAPDILGPEAPDPDLSPLPPGLRRLMGVILAGVTLLEPDPDGPTAPLTGLGIGVKPYRGTARVADDPGRAVAEMQPGDVLVAPWTAPSFNAVVAIAGGVVVQEGGLLCHAAVMARELGIPAVIGCTDAMTEIRSGDEVEVDPAAGEVRILNRAL